MKKQRNLPLSKQYRESDSPDSGQTDGSFIEYYSQDERDFVGPLRREVGRFKGINRFGERNVHHDHYQDEQYSSHYDPTFEDEMGMKHPYEHGGPYNRWSDDLRSDSSRENHSGKGPKNYRRSREKMIEEASEILMRDYALDASEIEVDVQGDVLVLKGQVESRRDKKRAEDLVEDIPGIEDVHNHLTIKYGHVDGWIPGVEHVPERGGRHERE